MLTFLHNAPKYINYWKQEGFFTSQTSPTVNICFWLCAAVRFLQHQVVNGAEEENIHWLNDICVWIFSCHYNHQTEWTYCALTVKQHKDPGGRENITYNLFIACLDLIWGHWGQSGTWTGWRRHHRFNPRLGLQSLHLLSLVTLSSLLLLFCTGILQTEDTQNEHMHRFYLRFTLQSCTQYKRTGLSHWHSRQVKQVKSTFHTVKCQNLYLNQMASLMNSLSSLIYILYGGRNKLTGTYKRLKCQILVH